MPAEKVQHGGPGRVDDVPARHECRLHVWQQIHQAPVDGMKGHRGARSRMATGHRRIAVDRGRTSAAASWPVGSRTPENRPRRGNGRLFSIAQGTHAKKRDSGIDEQAEPNYWRLGRELTSLRVCFRRMPAASVLGIVGQDAHSNPSAGLGRCSSADGPKNTPRRELYDPLDSPHWHCWIGHDFARFVLVGSGRSVALRVGLEHVRLGSCWQAGGRRTRTPGRRSAGQSRPSVGFVLPCPTGFAMLCSAR